MPTHIVSADELKAGIPVFVLFNDCGLCETRSAARRMARQGGLYVHGRTVGEDVLVTTEDLEDGEMILRAGKKKHRRIVVG